MKQKRSEQSSCLLRQFVLSHTAYSKKATDNHAPLAAVLTSNTSRTVRLGYGLIMNHPFVDGNKRIGVHAMLVLLALNGIELRFEQFLPDRNYIYVERRQLPRGQPSTRLL